MAVEPHKHCPICGSPIPLNERVCSPDCETVLKNRTEQQRKSRIILWVVIAIFVILVLLKILKVW